MNRHNDQIPMRVEFCPDDFRTGKGHPWHICDESEERVIGWRIVFRGTHKECTDWLQANRTDHEQNYR